MKQNKHPIYTGALWLTLTGLFCRFIGFYYKIFLSRTIGAKELGLYQLSMPLLGIGVAFANAGIHTAISKHVAAAASKAQSKRYLYVGLIFSIGVGCAFSIPCFFLSEWIAETFFCTPNIAGLLQILSLCIPLECFHGCINGYYYGQQKAAFPSFGQCIEQIIRVCSVFVIYLVLQQNGGDFSKIHAMLGLLFGECASTLYYLTLLSQQNPNKTKHLHFNVTLRELLPMALPVTATKLSLTFLSSFENISIPLRLVQFGLNQTQSLSIYGIYSGMAAPMVFFPTVLANSIAVMLLPSISRAKAEKKTAYIQHSISIGFALCMLLGFICAFIFYFFGDFMGEFLFHNQVAGIYIKTLGWLCPFLFLGITMNSILNGLGNTKDTFIISVSGASLRLLFVLFAIPQYGFRAYLLGVLTSQIASSFLAYLRLVQITKKESVS